MACEHLHQVVWHQNQCYGRKSIGGWCQLQVEDTVWLYSLVVSKGQATKFHRPWRGPYWAIMLHTSWCRQTKVNDSGMWHGILEVYTHSEEMWCSLWQDLRWVIALALPVKISLYRVKSNCPQSHHFIITAFLGNRSYVTHPSPEKD